MMQGSRSAEFLTKVSTVKTSPKWSFKGRRESPRNLETPGPGTYVSCPSTPNMRKTPSYGFGTSPREALSTRNAPGPGQYTPADTRAGYPKYGFGTSQRQNKQGQTASSPGPGSYGYRAHMGAEGPKHALAGRREGLKHMDVPGPGSYKAEDTSIQGAQNPKYGFGTSPRGNRSSALTPGPGAYNNSNPSSPAGPKYTMTSKRDLSKNLATPGPGSYCGAHTTFGY
uniref:Uncharacterized protein n=1 Tax=Alexandrium catenella TaxID=2925 RepID=A0A7S1MBX9_ALECA|mmetsp:Transcript_23866/g.65011  ORF Transcript_23866/g.65011 Transcript_23866/m.65011 type:complete len:226 (+) Transcript_23866:64-741(+)